MNAIDHIDDDIFKDWFDYSKTEFQRICIYAKTCQSKHILFFCASYGQVFLIVNWHFSSESAIKLLPII